jgi:FkbM family methyltransferase
VKIADWVKAKFNGPGRKLFIECGAHYGQDTRWLAEIPGAIVHALEPDPRNFPVLEGACGKLPNVKLHQVAACGQTTIRVLYLSHTAHGRKYTKSSSILQPTGHLSRHPAIQFKGSVEVECIRLDDLATREGIGQCDLIWADVQGAEAELIHGAADLLMRTRFFYTEYDDEPQYDGQPSLAEILLMLPGWRVVERYAYDVLLENLTWPGSSAF